MGIFARRFEPGLAAEDSNAWRLLGSVAANRLYQQGAMLLILVLTARWLGPDGRGVLAAAIAWVQLAGTATGLSLGKVAFQYGAENKQRVRSGSLLATMAASFAIAYGTLIFALSFASLLGVHLLLGEFPPLVVALIALTIPLFVWEDFAFYLLSSRSLLAKNLTIVSIGRTASVLLVLLFVWGIPLGVTGAMAALLIGQAISSFWTLNIAYGQGAGPPSVDSSILKVIVSKSIRLHPQTLAATVIGASDVVLLHALRGDTEAGQYQAAWALAAVIGLAAAPVSNLSYQLIAQRGPDGAWPKQLRLVALTIALAAVASLVAAAIAPAVVPMLLGDEFKASANLLVGLLPLSFAQVLSSLMTPQWVGQGRFATFSILTVGIALVSLSVNIVFIPLFDVWGAIYTSWITATLLIASHGGLAVKTTLRYGVR